MSFNGRPRTIESTLGRRQPVTMATKGRNIASRSAAKTSHALYVGVRQKLDDLGIDLFLSTDSTPLVARLLDELVKARQASLVPTNHSGGC